MLLIEAKEKLQPVIGKLLVDVFDPEKVEYSYGLSNGGIGHLVEDFVGIPHTSNLLDFEDGELKTAKCDRYGSPEANIAVSHLKANDFETIISDTFYFNRSDLWKKIQNMLYVGIYRGYDFSYCRFIDLLHIDLTEDRFRDISNRISSDFYGIMNALKSRVYSDREKLAYYSPWSGSLIYRDYWLIDNFYCLCKPIDNQFNDYLVCYKYRWYLKKKFIQDVKDIILEN